MNPIFVRVTTNGRDLYISYKINGRRIFRDLFHADDFDRRTFTPKKDCTLFRFDSINPQSFPIVSINIEKGLIYFLSDYDIENSPWETRGIKSDFPLTLLKGVDNVLL